MEIKIKNCNNIDEATIQIESGRLNIKYGINGTGKSTISKAIELAVSENGDISKLLPFKHVGKPSTQENSPHVSGLESVSSVLVFNEEFVNQIVFRKEEIVDNSFEIFIKTKDYDSKMAEIDKLIIDIKETFSKNEQIEKVLNDLMQLSEAFGKPNKNGGIAASSGVMKGIGKGNPIENVPTGLESYKPFLEADNNIKWIKWQTEGNQFLELADDCPYCASAIPDRKETIQSVSETYNSTDVQHLNKLIVAMEGLGEYFSDSTKALIQEMLKNKGSLSPEQKKLLEEIRDQIVALKNRLSILKNMDYFILKSDSDVEQKIKSMRIEIGSFPHMDSMETRGILEKINNSLDRVLENVGKLKGQINIQKAWIEKTIKNNKREINEFLDNAGYSYHVDIEEEDNAYKMKLKHSDAEAAISDSTNHLSYGEKNAFAVILFMYSCLSKNPDLIVLDDPISSYDKNKKFAIINRLFNEENSYKGKTVLMLTHDFEPIVDMKKTLSRKFQPSPNTSFLSNSNGVLQETAIEKADILTFSQLCKNNIDNNTNDIIKCIYLRRYYETLGTKENEYNLLSSLVHHRLAPTYDMKGEYLMSQTDIEQATKDILTFIPSFDYNSILAVITDKIKMRSLYDEASNNYEKLQIFRMRSPYGKHGVEEVDKYINETYHIENEYIMQLDPSKYEVVPHYLILKCNESLSKEQNAEAA